MATQSIIKDIVIRGEKTARALVEALGKAADSGLGYGRTNWRG